MIAVPATSILGKSKDHRLHEDLRGREKLK
jgi:hypothetical protein